MAALRGLSRPRIILFHAVPNALGAMVNVLALHVAFLLSGVVAIEVLFEFPGIGRLLLDSVGLQDVPLVQACALVLGSGYVLINLAADVAVALIDPRVGQRTG
jgi:peptide/nickel transport system permease protein